MSEKYGILLERNNDLSVARGHESISKKEEIELDKRISGAVQCFQHIKNNCLFSDRENCNLKINHTPQNLTIFV